MTNSISPAVAPRLSGPWVKKKLWILCLVFTTAVFMATGVYFVSANWPIRWLSDGQSRDEDYARFLPRNVMAAYAGTGFLQSHSRDELRES